MSDLEPAEAEELVRLLLKAQEPGGTIEIPMTWEQYEQLGGPKMEYIDGRLTWTGSPQASAPSITCPRCGMTSYHPEDIKQGYCGRCHDWTGNARS